MAKNIRQIFRDLFRVLISTKYQNLATSMAYSTVLSIVPLVAIFLALAKVFGYLVPAVERFKPDILTFFAAGTGPTIVEGLEQSVQRIHSGALGSLGLLTLLFISTKLLSDVDLAFQDMWEVKMSRPWMKRLALYWLVIFLGPLLLTLIFALTTSAYLGAFPSWLTKSVAIVGLVLVLSLLFKYVPNTLVHWPSAIIGAFFAALPLMVLQEGYSWATRNIMYYNQVYGSLSSVFLFLVWVLIVWNIILFGVAVSAAVQKNKRV